MGKKELIIITAFLLGISAVFVVAWKMPGSGSNFLKKDFSTGFLAPGKVSPEGIIAPEKIIEKIPASIKANYKIVGGAFVMEPEDNDGVTAEVGNRAAKEFVPELTLSRWQGEVGLRVKADLTDVPKESQQLSFADNKIEVQTPKKDYHFYSHQPDTINPDGGYEIDTILKEKPASNKIEFSIETQGLDFFYQPELTQKEKDEGNVRAENVVGSYAVYYKDNKSGDYSQIGGKNYGAGKAFHIYRPKIKDASGKEIWGELKIDEQNKKLIVTVPHDFLGKASYPITVDPTFGYMRAGASNANTGSIIRCSTFAGEYGTGESITLYKTTSAGFFKEAIYTDSDSVFVASTTVSAFTGGGATWKNLSFLAPIPTLTSLSYNVCIWSSLLSVAYDTGTNNQGHSQALTYGGTVIWPNPATFVHDNNKYSIYVTVADQPVGVKIKGGVRIKGGVNIKKN